MKFDYENRIWYKKASFYTEQNNTDIQVDIYLDKYSGLVEVEVSHCGRGCGDCWTKPEVYETTKEPFFLVVQKWIGIYEQEGTVSPDRISRKESW